MTNNSGHDCSKCKLGRKTFGDWYYCNGNSCEMKVRADERQKFVKERYKDLKQLYDLMNDYFERVNIFSDKSVLERLALEISTRGMQITGEIIDGYEEEGEKKNDY